MNDGTIEASHTEMYKDSQPYFIHDQVSMVHVAKLDNLIAQYKPQINIGNVRDQYRLLNNTSITFTNLQEAICSSLLRWVVPPDAFIIMNSTVFNGCCAVASELLKEKHPELSLLLLSGCSMGVNEETGGSVAVLQPMCYKDPSRISKQNLREMYPFWTVADRITPLNQSKLTNSKHVMHDYLRKLLDDSHKEWEPVLTDTNHIYFKRWIHNGKVIPLSNLYTHLIEFFLDLDNLGNISRDTYNSAIAGTLEI